MEGRPERHHRGRRLIPRDYITKLRALYQRRKGRDLFDIDLGLQHPSLDRHRLVTVFLRYMDHG